MSIDKNNGKETDILWTNIRKGKHIKYKFGVSIHTKNSTLRFEQYPIINNCESNE